MLSKAIFGKWKLWAVGSLVLALSVALWQWRGEIETRVRYAVQGEQIEQTLHDTQQQLIESELERKRLDALAKDRGESLRQLTQRERDQERTLRRLLEDNDEIRRWGDDRLPDGVIDRLRSKGDNGNRD